MLQAFGKGTTFNAEDADASDTIEHVLATYVDEKHAEVMRMWQDIADKIIMQNICVEKEHGVVHATPNIDHILRLRDFSSSCISSLVSCPVSPGCVYDSKERMQIFCEDFDGQDHHAGCRGQRHH